MAEMHLWDLKVKKKSACGPFTKHQERSHLYKNQMDKPCFQHDAAYTTNTKI